MPAQTGLAHFGVLKGGPVWNFFKRAGPFGNLKQGRPIRRFQTEWAPLENSNGPARFQIFKGTRSEIFKAEPGPVLKSEMGRGPF